MCCRRTGGFTLVELLVVVVVIGILIACAAPSFVGAEDKSRLAAVKNNMHTAQLCAEAYATDAGGDYPVNASDLTAYYPSGGNHIGGAAGLRPRNPFSSAADEPLYTETFTTGAEVRNARIAKPTAGPGVPGQIGYCQLDAGKSYAVSGMDNHSVRVAGPNNGTIILSNQ